jgi:hypothetical protein
MRRTSRLYKRISARLKLPRGILREKTSPRVATLMPLLATLGQCQRRDRPESHWQQPSGKSWLSTSLSPSRVRRLHRADFDHLCILARFVPGRCEAPLRRVYACGRQHAASGTASISCTPALPSFPKAAYDISRYCARYVIVVGHLTTHPGPSSFQRGHPTGASACPSGFFELPPDCHPDCV